MFEYSCGRLDPHEPHVWRKIRLPTAYLSAAVEKYQCPGRVAKSELDE